MKTMKFIQISFLIIALSLYTAFTCFSCKGKKNSEQKTANITPTNTPEKQSDEIDTPVFDQTIENPQEVDFSNYDDSMETWFQIIINEKARSAELNLKENNLLYQGLAILEFDDITNLQEKIRDLRFSSNLIDSPSYSSKSLTVFDGSSYQVLKTFIGTRLDESSASFEATMQTFDAIKTKLKTNGAIMKTDLSVLNSSLNASDFHESETLKTFNGVIGEPQILNFNIYDEQSNSLAQIAVNAQNKGFSSKLRTKNSSCKGGVTIAQEKLDEIVTLVKTLKKSQRISVGSKAPILQISVYDGGVTYIVKNGTQTFVDESSAEYVSLLQKIDDLTKNWTPCQIALITQDETPASSTDNCQPTDLECLKTILNNSF